MVGKKSVNWTVANKAKALEGLLSFNAVRVEKDVCDQVGLTYIFWAHVTKRYIDRHLYWFVKSKLTRTLLNGSLI